MPGEYSAQLDAIVKALNRPSIPTWIIAIISALLGFLVSVSGQLFQYWYAEHKARNIMRRIVYSELG